MGPGTQSAFQHDARRQRDGTISIFDNGVHPKVHDRSRGIVVELDEEKMSAKQLREYTSPKKRSPPPRETCNSCPTPTC